MKEEIKKIAKNYKTTLMAVLALACVGLYFFDYISTEQFTLGTALLTSAGLLIARDAK
jgi:hypothetical protein